LADQAFTFCPPGRPGWKPLQLHRTDRRWPGDRVVSAISDGVLSASISLLEVVPAFRGRGIGTRLMRLVLERLEGFYMVDLSCDEDLVPFYLRFGMQETRAMSIRRPHAISDDRP
jgi:GNAT superfamily N-acetyltransferase